MSSRMLSRLLRLSANVWKGGPRSGDRTEQCTLRLACMAADDYAVSVFDSAGALESEEGGA
eukprot:225987-Rhodomonas_salina.2